MKYGFEILAVFLFLVSCGTNKPSERALSSTKEGAVTMSGSCIVRNESFVEANFVSANGNTANGVLSFLQAKCDDLCSDPVAHVNNWTCSLVDVAPPGPTVSMNGSCLVKNSLGTERNLVSANGNTEYGVRAILAAQCDNYCSGPVPNVYGWTCQLVDVGSGS